MICKQIKFLNPYGNDDNEILGGIGIYENDELVVVICGCCGGTFEPDEIKILSVYEGEWIDLVDTILGDDTTNF